MKTSKNRIQTGAVSRDVFRVSIVDHFLSLNTGIWYLIWAPEPEREFHLGQLTSFWECFLWEWGLLLPPYLSEIIMFGFPSGQYLPLLDTTMAPAGLRVAFYNHDACEGPVAWEHSGTRVFPKVERTQPVGSWSSPPDGGG